MGGTLGNNNPSRGKWAKSVIEKRLAERAAMEVIIDKLIDQAMEGDKVAAGMIMDRTDGKPNQSMDIDANVKTHEMGIDELDRERVKDS